MRAMPKPRPPHLQCERTRHGKTVWYFRRDRHSKRIRIHGEFGSPEFKCNYDAAAIGKAIPASDAPAKETLAWLVARYRESGAWTKNLSAATRKQRSAIMKQIVATAGAEPLTAIDRDAVVRGMERRSDTPFQARHFRDTVNGLFVWAVEAKHAKINPAEGVKARKPKSSGFPTWTDEEIEQFEARWPLGTRERVMFSIFLYTGLRRGDAAVLGRPHVRNGIIRIDTEKTGTRVTIPLLPILERTLNAGPTGELTFIASADGQPMGKEVIGNLFRTACREAGINKSAHGLRKAAATRLANNGATVAQLEAIFGWEGGRMASHYTKQADREHLAVAAMSKLTKKR
jgi:integrase